MNFAIKAGIAANFLASNDIETRETEKTSQPEIIAALAKLFTVKIACW